MNDRMMQVNHPMNELLPHPISEIVPKMTDYEREAMLASVGQVGLLLDIVVYEGQILDGRNRHWACLETGKEIRVTEFTGTWDDAVRYVKSVNLDRRHLTEAQRAMTAARLVNIGGPGRPQKNASNEAIISQTHAGELLNVPRTAVQQAAKVLNKGIPELIEKVDSGEIKHISTAATIASNPPKKQPRVIANKLNKIADYGSKIRVESTLKNARKSLDICIIDNADIPKSKTHIIAFLEFAAIICDGEKDPQYKAEAREGARRIRGLIEDWEETDVVDQVHDLGEAVIKALSECPLNDADLRARLTIVDDDGERLVLTKEDYVFIIKELETGGWIEIFRNPIKKEGARGQTEKLWRLTDKGGVAEYRERVRGELGDD